MQSLNTWLAQSRVAAQQLKTLSTWQKNRVLRRLADELEAQQEGILTANKQDIERAQDRGLSASVIERLLLTPARIKAMAEAVRQVATLDDPVGQLVQQTKRDDGLLIERRRVPIGVILMIYESRPNVTIDAASLGFKSGNVTLLRGGSESVASNQCLLSLWSQVLAELDLNPAMVRGVPEQSHEMVATLLKQDRWIDLVIPRGGSNLIKAVSEQSCIPVLKHDKGVCHCYVDEFADLNQALSIVKDGKLSRPSVCNALEGLVVHKAIVNDFLNLLTEICQQHDCELRIYPHKDLDKGFNATATLDEFGCEYLDKILSVKIVDDAQQAIEHIRQYSSSHTEVVVSQSDSVINQFVEAIDSAVVMVNCSSRFSDGGELGLGAEIGISTSKLHWYGPMGLEALTIPRFIVKGQGQVRHSESLNLT
ncbi:glutamate-5-semialdehyde dehydrogenase [Pleionea sp. CnH1-48]|uniref:glutamate-5-semialdehyde dehydrogenase n=1 Tax=Pleionea sp. CnH1-48 TaxID=2954494 RepID=UPI002096C214|nr:glutamate-5-semialdehyde dehydrogenase [Pleionea sp. CnH1-48]MCO7227257.1 glutamate-5-semialdehyde dehydrogenase [Pleionea sp. CnH1-48]